MPKYEYACKSCGERLEVKQSFTDDPLTDCPACGGRLRKVFSSPAIVLRGPGFYRTDHRSPYRPDGILPGSKEKDRDPAESKGSADSKDAKGGDAKGGDAKGGDAKGGDSGGDSKGSGSGSDSGSGSGDKVGDSKGSGGSRGSESRETGGSRESREPRGSGSGGSSSGPGASAGDTRGAKDAARTA